MKDCRRGKPAFFTRGIWLFLVIILIASMVGWSWIRGVGMNEKIMMRTSFDQPLFDATKWFASGMYQRVRLDDKTRPYQEYADVYMRRVSPPPFPDEQVQLLRVWIHGALTDVWGSRSRPKVPPSVEGIGVGADFDPRPQIVYTSSGFDNPDNSIDYYMFYTLLEGQRFFVSIERDGVSGDVIFASRQHSIRIPKDEEEARFQKLQAQASLHSELGAPGWKVRSGTPCPWPGSWECLEIPVGRQTFAHGVMLPDLNGQDVTWRFVAGG